MFFGALKIQSVILTVAALALGMSSAVAETRVSNLLGRVVVTPDGELLGRIEDMSIDLQANQVRFIVVSIGSYLIDDNLIAVDPNALGPSEDGNYLVVYADNLGSARRFSASGWPSAADVKPSADRTPVEVKDPEALAGQSESINADDVVATISDGRRTATMKQDGQRAVIEAPAGLRAPDQPATVKPKQFQGGRTELARSAAFDRLDEDGDGYLSRREIASRLDRKTKFSALDLDGNDGIDEFEYQVLSNQRP